jgi:general secretion pathway protein J
MTRNFIQRGTLNKRSGFTLLEVLIATSILGILLVLLFASLRICIRSWEAGEEHIKSVSDMSVIQNFFRSHLSAALFLSSYNDEDPVVFFQGRKDSIQFVSVLPASAGRKGPHLFKIELEDKYEVSLNATLSPFFPAIDDTDDLQDKITILSNLKNFEIAYWGVKEQGDEADWHSEWEDVTVLPKMVKIDIELENQKPWPTLIVALKTADISQ